MLNGLNGKSNYRRSNHPFTQNKEALYCFHHEKPIYGWNACIFLTVEWTESSSTSLLAIFLIKNQAYSYISGLGLIISVSAKTQRHFEASPPSLGSTHRGRGMFCELSGRRKLILLCFSAGSFLSSPSLVWGPFSSVTRIVNL